MSDLVIIILAALWVLWLAVGFYRVMCTNKYPLWPMDDDDLKWLDKLQ